MIIAETRRFHYKVKRTNVLYSSFIIHNSSFLQLLPQPGHRNIELFAVFGHGPAGNVVAFIVQNLFEFVVRQGVQFGLGIDQVFQDIFYFPAAHIFARVGRNTFGEEIFEGVNAKFGLYGFTVGHPRYGRNVHINHGRNILQNHGPEPGFVARQEEIVLKAYDGIHGSEQRLLALLDGVNKPLGGIQFLLHKRDRFFQVFILLFALVIRVEHIGKGAADAQFGRVLGVQRQFQFTVAAGQNKVGNQVLGRTGFTIYGTGFWIEFNDDINHFFQRIVADTKPTLNFVVMLFGKFVEEIVDDPNSQHVVGVGGIFSL